MSDDVETSTKRASIERAFVQLESCAAAATTAAKVVQRTTTVILKAAQAGDLTALRRAADRLEDGQVTLHAALGSLATAGQVIDDDTLRSGLEDEVLAEAQRVGVPIQRHDAQLLAFPATVTLQPERRAVVINGKRLSTVRPTRIVEAIAAARSLKPRMAPETFIEVLYRAYALLLGEDNQHRGTTFNALYDVSTVLPDACRGYDRNQFMRDVVSLDRSGVTLTASRHRISFPAATGTKGSEKAFTFRDESGRPVTYFGVRFTQETA